LDFIIGMVTEEVDESFQLSAGGFQPEKVAERVES
jgi:hypothetical protein